MNVPRPALGVERFSKTQTSQVRWDILTRTELRSEKLFISVVYTTTLKEPHVFETRAFPRIGYALTTD